MSKSEKKRRERAGKDHGLRRAQRLLREFGDRALEFDHRSEVARMMKEFRDELVRDVAGSEEQLSKQQEIIVNMICRTWFMLESIDVYLLGLPQLMNKRSRELYPIVLQREQLVRSITFQLRQLGLERRAKDVTPTLQDILAEDKEDQHDDE